MTWIKTIPLSEASEELKQAIEAQHELYPEEYGQPVHPTGDGTSGIVGRCLDGVRSDPGPIDGVGEHPRG